MTKPHSRLPATRAIHVSPLTLGIRRILRERRALVVASTVLGGPLLGGIAVAAELPEIIVTAQKREENLQDIPMSVQVLGQEQLQNLNISSFDDFVLFAPSVSVQSSGPGQSQIYMRGVSDGGDGNFSGTSPSVAVYLDEQPVTAIGRNLDVHIYDVARIETIPGPQGTLYGANSQAGTLRIITNKPDTSKSEFGYDLGVNTVRGGDPGHSVEGFANFPFADRAAIRLVGWYVEDGGWIDAVEGSQTFSVSGITVSNTGNADPAKNTVESDYNTLTNSGARAALGVDLNDRWTATASVITQQQESDGVFADQPDTVGQGKVVRFYQDDYEDDWTQLGLTVEGDLGFADLIFAGSYLDRDVTYAIDYTQYAEYSAYLEPYYTCVAYDYDNCTDPRIQYENDSQYKRSTVELRLQSSGTESLSWVAGLFYTEDEHKYFNQWHIPTIPDGNAIPVDPADLCNGCDQGVRNVRGVDDLYFATNQVRDTSEVAAFGELTYSFTSKWSGTLGARWFETEDELSGFVGSRFNCFDPATGNRIGNGDPDNPDDCGGGLESDNDDVTWKANLTYRVTDNLLTYVTYSEGFRPGGINREDSPVIPQLYQSDTLNNYELGWKSTLADGRVRFNGAVYYMDWQDLQLTRFDPSVNSFIGLTANTDGAEVTGVEGEVDWLVTDAWTLMAAASYNNAELSADYVRSEGDAEPFAPDGTDLPFTPDLKYTLLSRYQFMLGNWESYAQASWSWTDDSWNDLEVASREEQDSYGILNASVGAIIGKSSVDLYADNLTDENAEIARYTRAGDNRVVANRPLTIGVRFRQRF